YLERASIPHYIDKLPKDYFVIKTYSTPPEPHPSQPPPAAAKQNGSHHATKSSVAGQDNRGGVTVRVRERGWECDRDRDSRDRNRDGSPDSDLRADSDHERRQEKERERWRDRDRDSWDMDRDVPRDSDSQADCDCERRQQKEKEKGLPQEPGDYHAWRSNALKNIAYRQTELLKCALKTWAHASPTACLTALRLLDGLPVPTPILDQTKTLTNTCQHLAYAGYADLLLSPTNALADQDWLIALKAYTTHSPGLYEETEMALRIRDEANLADVASSTMGDGSEGGDVYRSISSLLHGRPHSGQAASHKSQFTNAHAYEPVSLGHSRPTRKRARTPSPQDNPHPRNPSPGPGPDGRSASNSSMVNEELSSRYEDSGTIGIGLEQNQRVVAGHFRRWKRRNTMEVERDD
ncbi:hypothetical protein HK097_008744, partial [Rhizophlyctis rosea]